MWYRVLGLPDSWTNTPSFLCSSALCEEKKVLTLTAGSSNDQEFVVRIPARNAKRNFHIMKFNASLNMDVTKWTQVGLPLRFVTYRTNFLPLISHKNSTLPLRTKVSSGNPYWRDNAVDFLVLTSINQLLLTMKRSTILTEPSPSVSVPWSPFQIKPSLSFYISLLFFQH